MKACKESIAKDMAHSKERLKKINEALKEGLKRRSK